METANMTLNEVLNALGYDVATSPIGGRKNIFDPKTSKCVLMDATANETWKWLRENGKIK